MTPTDIAKACIEQINAGYTGVMLTVPRKPVSKAKDAKVRFAGGFKRCPMGKFVQDMPGGASMCAFKCDEILAYLHVQGLINVVDKDPRPPTTVEPVTTPVEPEGVS